MANIDLKEPDFEKMVTQDMIGRIRKVKYFSDSQYANLNIPETLKFFFNRYVKQLYDFTEVTKDTVITDIGTGFGWLSIVFASATDAKRIIAIEPDKERLLAAKEIAGYLGVSDKIEWRVELLGELTIKDKEADIVYCIEVIEHVYKSKAAIKDLCRICKDILVVTTPNLWFPKIAHDTQLPFCHWLPVPVRKVYAKAFHRTKSENDNLFWSPLSLKRNMKGFKRISKWLHYSSYKRFLGTYPFYLPYGRGRYIKNIGRSKKLFYAIISILGTRAHIVSPNLAGVFKRIK